jgi:heme oxygenase (biliverdin-IX-beta and delta-forming)
MTEFADELRSGTRAAHVQIESNPLHRSLRDGTMDRDGYRFLLEKMHGFVAEFESQAAPRPEWASWSFDFEARRKSTAIRRDLLALGAKLEEIERLPMAQLDLASAPFETLLGYLYVLEGSTLGGQILARIVQARWDAGPANGAAYFCSYGAGVRERWRECQILLNRVAVSFGKGKEIIASAQAAFGSLDGWLRQSGPGCGSEFPARLVSPPG